jgi:membrane-anchored protein YejM (alkaline phosphatase superfamily)
MRPSVPVPPPAPPRSRAPGARHRAALLAFALANVAAAAVHAAGYDRAVPDGVGGRPLLLLGLAGQLLVAFLVPAALLVPLARLRAGRAALVVLAPAVASALHLVLYVDRKVFAAMGMHVNGLLLDVALSQGGLRALDVQPSEWRRLVGGAAVVLAAEGAGYAWAALRPPGALALGTRAWLRAAAAAVCLLSAERVLYVVSTVSGWSTAAVSAAPAYGVERLFRLRRAEPAPLRYPRAPVTFAPGARRPNIVWLVIESWRRDALGSVVTPALWRQSRRSLTFLNHVSGGNASVAGTYSQFYGLHANAVAALSRTREPPVLTRALRDLGYRIRVVASPVIEFADMDATVFGGGRGEIVRASGAGSAARDRFAAARAVEFLREARPDAPFALVVLLDGTHMPYDFDPARARFRPYETELAYAELDRSRGVEGVRNRYLDALAEVDEAAGRILDALEATGLAGETITVVAGDHGEQLLDHGRIGHQLSLSRVETETPLLLRVPGVAPAERTDLSRHVDLPPTLLGLLGVRNPPSDYSVGRSLLTDPEPEYAVIVGLMAVGVRTRDGWTVEWDTGDLALQARSGYRVMDASYREVPGAAPPSRDAVAAGLADLQRFTR